MLEGRKIICIIPARGGSVGLPGKNIRPVAGKPMIAHAIEKALSVREIDRVIVSTDSETIAEVARSHGADVPFLRDAALARSDTPMTPVIIDALSRVEAEGEYYDYAVMLQANSPLLRSEEILAVTQKIVTESHDVVFTVCEVGHPPQWTLHLRPDGPAFAFHDMCDTSGDRRQDLDVLYRSTGAVYAVSIPYLFGNPATARLCLPAPGQRSAVVVTDCFSSVDIDTELDLLLAKAIFAKMAGDAP